MFFIRIREKKAWGTINIKQSLLLNSICVKSLRWFPKSSNDDHLGGGSVKNVVVLRFKIYTYFYLLPSTSLDVFGCIKTCILTLGCSLDGLILLRLFFVYFVLLISYVGYWYSVSLWLLLYNWKSSGWLNNR